MGGAETGLGARGACEGSTVLVHGVLGESEGGEKHLEWFKVV